ncbi:MAG: hypothetical protein HY735_04550 [Verrucomicrobia bacterium]|nr:hypothetical protein [Verrucomicrobiota bacterium]
MKPFAQLKLCRATLVALVALLPQVSAQVTITVLHKFSDAEGTFPTGRLVEGSDGAFYGLAPMMVRDTSCGVNYWKEVTVLFTERPEGAVVSAAEPCLE